MRPQLAPAQWRPKRSQHKTTCAIGREPIVRPGKSEQAMVVVIELRRARSLTAPNAPNAPNRWMDGGICACCALIGRSRKSLTTHTNTRDLCESAALCVVYWNCTLAIITAIVTHNWGPSTGAVLAGAGVVAGWLALSTRHLATWTSHSGRQDRNRSIIFIGSWLDSNRTRLGSKRLSSRSLRLAPPLELAPFNDVVVVGCS